MLGQAAPVTLATLPSARMRARLQSLPVPARERALAWMNRLSFPARDLATMDVDAGGGVLYVDPPPRCFGGICASFDAHAATDADADFDLSLLAAAADDAFALHSRPGATNVVYLDFDGHTITGTAWNRYKDPIQARPFDTDGNSTAFSDSERRAIAEVWHRVAEDYAPFDIDVTTEDPVTFTSTTGRILITSDTDASGQPMPYDSAGGVAYVGVWGRGDYPSRYSPALVYYDNLSNAANYIAEAASHEFGHNLGLSHHGTSTADYYRGHGSGSISWAPVMGVAYYAQVSQWSNGDYPGANNRQDDIAVIADLLGVVGDDHGDTAATATALVVGAGGTIAVSTPEDDPHDELPHNKGIIEQAGDSDYFFFRAGAGTLDIAVTPAWEAFYRNSSRGANLDVEVRLMNTQGEVLQIATPATETHASLRAAVAAGDYYLSVTGVGSANYSAYDSLGQYFISGTIPQPADNLAPTAAFGYGCAELVCSFTDASSDVDGSLTAWSWRFGDGKSSASRSPGHTYAAAGEYTVTLTVTDDDGASDDVSQTVNVSDGDGDGDGDVCELPPASLFNISTRARVRGGDGTMIGGFVIRGDRPKRVLIRARGPSLAASGVDGAMADPTVRLFSGATQIGSNDNWRSGGQSAEIAATGRAPTMDAEAALLATLSPGAYTAHVNDAAGATGIAIIEVFGVDEEQDSRLFNVSTRAGVETGDGVSIGGFVIRGTGTKRVLVRARGPSLAAAGLVGTLSDPTLQVFSGGTAIASNDDWRSDARADEITATERAPQHDREAALLLDLAPGAYTAIMSGDGGTSGIGIIEVIAVDEDSCH
jgi:PKD repeat protein